MEVFEGDYVSHWCTQRHGITDMEGQVYSWKANKLLHVVTYCWFIEVINNPSEKLNISWLKFWRRLQMMCQASFFFLTTWWVKENVCLSKSFSCSHYSRQWNHNPFNLSVSILTSKLIHCKGDFFFTEHNYLVQSFYLWFKNTYCSKCDQMGKCCIIFLSWSFFPEQLIPI